MAKKDSEVITLHTYDDRDLIYKHSTNSSIPMQEWLAYIPQGRGDFAKIQFAKLRALIAAHNKCPYCKKEACPDGRYQERTFFPHGEKGNVDFEVCCEQRKPLTNTREKMEWLKQKLQNEEDC